nr:lytic transglycosylase domain-containing protein [Aquamicrobium sp. LC103]
MSGCTTAELATDPTLALNADDPSLPDTIAVVPSPSSAGTVVASAEDAAVTPAAYAGATPDRPFSEALIANRQVAARSPELDALIARYASHYQVPETLVRRVVKRESTFNPAARNGPYWGLMQIRHDTARSMGFDGPANGLLDAETNLTYAVKYLRGAYLTAGGNHDQAVRLYARGYYYDAKRKGLLEETGLRGPRRAHLPAGSLAAQVPAPAPLPQAAPTPAAERFGAPVAAASLPGVSGEAAVGFAAAQEESR